MTEKHILSLLVKDEPGVMNRITGLFSRRNYNIDTITVGKTNVEGVSKIVLSLKANEKTLEQIKKQVNKIVEVVKIVEMKEKDAVVRELCLIKVSVKNQDARNEITSFAETFRANIVDITHNAATIQLTGKPSQIEAFLGLMQKFGIKEISRTGITALEREQNSSP